MKNLDLNVDSPDKVARVLRNAASYRAVCAFARSVAGIARGACLVVLNRDGDTVAIANTGAGIIERYALADASDDSCLAIRYTDEVVGTTKYDGYGANHARKRGFVVVP